MKKLSTVAVLLLAALLVVGAFRTTMAANSALAGTRWVLSSLNGQLPLPGDGITLEFGADGNASGSDGCNRYSVPYTVKGSSLTFGASTGITTMMACPEVVMTQATAYMDMLASVDKFDARGNQLTLVSGAKIVATFVAAGQDLAGTSWTVTAYNNGNEAVTSPIEGADLTINFDDDNRVAGNSGCNDFFASYLTSDNAILIGSIGSTRRFCEEPAGVMEQEAQFQAALQSATTYSVSGNRLELRNGADAIAVQAVRELTVAVPEPDPGEPTGRVTAPNGVNVRSGPGTNFPILVWRPLAQKVRSSVAVRTVSGGPLPCPLRPAAWAGSQRTL
ncbi:MAG: META domain-containing protein [Anaerolineales bacterium]|nr:META domain-containing protein [Anaerolineales bacterium]